MASEEPVRMFETEQNPFELTELDAPEEELLGRYLPIGDVAKSIGVNPSVLRFWEQEFPQLRPTKRGNRRYYCSEDVALIRTIQHLLYEEHYTILGARNKIHELQVQNKVKDLLEDEKFAPLQVKPKAEIKTADLLKELKAIRALLYSPGIQEQVRREKEAKAKAELDAVENFSLVSEDLSEIIARENQSAQKGGDSRNERDEADLETEEVVAPHSYDLGALGAEGDDFLTVPAKPSQKAPELTASESDVMTFEKPVVSSVSPQPVTQTQNVAAPVQTSAQTPVAPEKEDTQKPKVDTSHLVVPPLPGQQHGFTIGMKVQKSHPGSLTYGSQMVWKKK